MASFNPLLAIGPLFRTMPEGGFLGTAFAYRDTQYFVTAAHCVRDVAVDELGVLLPRHSEDFVHVTDVVIHPQADVAVLRTRSREDVPFEPFWNCVANWGLGEEFIAYGYPDARPAPDASPTPRLFRGHYQRFMDHHSHMAYRYVAGELSIPVPVGLSGGPLFRPGAPQMLTAIAVENMRSELVEDSIEEHSIDGHVMRTTLRQNVINYGVAVMLSPVSSWIDEHVPALDLEKLSSIARATRR